MKYPKRKSRQSTGVFSLLNTLLFFSVIFGFPAAPRCWAEEPETAPAVSFGVEADLNSRFLWRGIALSRGAVLQPAAYVTVHNVTVDVWSNCELRPNTGDRHFNETDLTISYAREWSKISFEPSLQTYLYPRDVDVPNTAEAALTLSYPVRSLEIFTRQIFDIAEYRGAYFGEAGVEWKKDLRHKVELSGSASAGWGSARFNNAYMSVSKSALNVVAFEIAVAWQPTRNLQIRPHLNLSTLVDRGLRRNVTEPDLKSAGVTMCLDF